MLCCAVLCCAVLCCAVLCCAVLYCAVLCCAVLYCTILYYTVLYCTVDVTCLLQVFKGLPQGNKRNSVFPEEVRFFELVVIYKIKLIIYL